MGATRGKRTESDHNRNPSGKRTGGVRSRIKAEAQKTERERGRPPTTTADLRADWREAMLKCGKEGKGPTSMMVELGIGKSALNTLLSADDSDFRDTYEQAGLLCQQWWEERGRLMADGKRRYGSAPVWSMNMTNRFGWKSGRNEVIGDPTAPVELASRKRDLTEAEVAERLQELGLPTSIFPEADEDADVEP